MSKHGRTARIYRIQVTRDDVHGWQYSEGREFGPQIHEGGSRRHISDEGTYLSFTSNARSWRRALDSFFFFAGTRLDLMLP